MKELALLLVVLVIVAAVMLVVYAWRRWRLAHKPDLPWRVVEHSDGEAVHVLCVKQGEPALEVGDSIPFAALDFDVQLYERRVEADARIMAMNNNRRLTK